MSGEEERAFDPIKDKRRQDAEAARERALNEARAARFEADVRQVIKTPHGRRVLEWLLREANVGNPFFPIQPINRDERTGQFFLGRRSLGLAIQAVIMDSDPAVLTTMRAEFEAPPDLRHAPKPDDE